MQINVTNGTISQVSQTLTPASGQTLPANIIVNGSSYTYNASTGVLTLTNLTDTTCFGLPACSSFSGLKVVDNTNYFTLRINDTSLDIAKLQAPVETGYLTFSSPNSFTLNVIDNQKYWDGTIEYSTDTITWNTWAGTSAISSASDGTNHNLYLRGSSNTYITGSNASTAAGKWELTGSNISCIGNIENLLDYTTAVSGNHPPMANYCYAYMFAYCRSLTSAPTLPATTLASYCYCYMFYGCTSLTSAPALPATTLANYCYSQMFYGCALTSAPTLPATTLAQNCYYYMFAGCTLTSAPALPATTLANYCYAYMFAYCRSLTSAPTLPATTLASYCYYYMFTGCTSLTSAPTLPATTLANFCYGYMFQNCTALTSAPSLPATTLENYCYYYMFTDCVSLTTPAIMCDGTTQAISANRCCYYMYNGCTSLNIYTTSTNHTAFYKAMTYSTTSSATNYRSSYRMFYKCKLDGTTSTGNYITASTQLYY